MREEDRGENVMKKRRKETANLRSKWKTDMYVIKKPKIFHGDQPQPQLSRSISTALTFILFKI